MFYVCIDCYMETVEWITQVIVNYQTSKTKQIQCCFLYETRQTDAIKARLTIVQSKILHRSNEILYGTRKRQMSKVCCRLAIRDSLSFCGDGGMSLMTDWNR